MKCRGIKIGQRFGNLTVKSFDKEYRKAGVLKVYWVCTDDDGNLFSISDHHLRLINTDALDTDGVDPVADRPRKRNKK